MRASLRSCSSDASVIGFSIQPHASAYIAFALSQFRVLETILLTDQAAVARDLLDAHVRGYSTTSHDLIHDLIP